MKSLFSHLVMICILLTNYSISIAAVNPISVTYLGSPVTKFSLNHRGSAYYLVALNNRVLPPNRSLSFNLNTSSSGTPGLNIQQITTGPTPASCNGVSLCANPFSLRAGQSCCLGLNLTSNGVGNYSLEPLVQSIPPAFSTKASSSLSISVTDPTNLSISPSALALSVNGGAAALTGNPRYFTIKNNGTAPALAFSYTVSGLPTGTNATSTCGNQLNPGETCRITIIPGSQATSNCITGIAPTPGVVYISSNSSAAADSNVEVLSYGCIEQSGYIFSIDDSTPASGSIGGKVLQTSNQTQLSGVYWDSSAGCLNLGAPSCYRTNAISASNGTFVTTTSPPGNSYLIYNVLTTTNSENPATYAGGLCSGTFSGYNDWYLPAICELGYGGNQYGINCGTSSSPLLQNVQSNLINFQGTDIAGLTPNRGQSSPGQYWSSTENPTTDALYAWEQTFNLTTPLQNGTSQKGYQQLGVRCARNLTF